MRIHNVLHLNGGDVTLVCSSHTRLAGTFLFGTAAGRDTRTLLMHAGPVSLRSIFAPVSVTLVPTESSR